MIIEFDKSFEKSLEKIKSKSVFEKIEKIILTFESLTSIDKMPNVKKTRWSKSATSILLFYDDRCNPKDVIKTMLKLDKSATSILLFMNFIIQKQNDQMYTQVFFSN